MNGFKRASRRQAAVVGLAVLMGTSFLGCHAGPRLFSKKDRDPHADKQELADKDKGKFINKKKARPESEYRRVDDDERVAKSEPKSEPKTKPKAKPSDSIRKPSADDTERALAIRKQVDEELKKSSRSSKTTPAPSKTAKPAEQPQFARRDTNKRPATDLLNDSLFDDELPETSPSAPKTAAKKPAAKPVTTAKAKSADEDPFKKSVVSPSNTKRPSDKVANVNFDDEDLDLGLDDELAEEAAELAEAKALAAQKSAALKKVAAPLRDPRTTPAAATMQRKFLEEVDELEADSLTFEEPSPQVAPAKEKARAILPTVKRTADTAKIDAAKIVAGQEVIDRRQTAQQTANQWRRDLERDELAEPEQDSVAPAPAPRATPRPSSAPISKGHFSPASLDEFTPPAKSQGAVLNGELIIDTNNLPSRFQRTSSSPNGTNNSHGAASRINSNSSENIEIAPGATQNRARPAGQISLQALSDAENSSGLTTADYDTSNTADDLGGLPSLKVESEAETGPQLASLEFASGVAPAPPDMAELAPAIGVAEPPSGTRGWKRTLLALSAMISAVGIGFALRRRTEMAAAPIQNPRSPSAGSHS